MTRKFTPRACRLAALLLSLSGCVTPPARCAAQAAGGPGAPDFGEGLKRYERGAAEGSAARAKDAGGQPEEVVRVDTSMTLLGVTVTDAAGARFVGGLTKDDFVVFEDGVPQRLDALTPGDDAARLPRSVVLIIDWSGSLLPYLDESLKAAKSLVERLAPGDEMAVVTDDVRLVAGFTKDKRRLRSALDSIGASARKGWRGKSRQFSALLATLRDLIGAERKRPIVIFQTDGDEAHNLQDPPRGGSTAPGVYYLSDIYAEVQRSRVRIYTLVPGEKLFGVSKEELTERGRRLVRGHGDEYAKRYRQYGVPQERKQVSDQVAHLVAARAAEGQEAAARVADISGGWAAFFERPEQAAAAYELILSDINRQYVIGYYPTNRARDGRLRRVRVEVRGHPDYVVRGRESYVALPR